VKRELFPDLEMNPAPGYDPFMPHDLMHLVVEAQLGLSRGVFGQLAAGGDAGTFHPTFNANETTRQIARVRKRVKVRGQKLLREGRDESSQSERATFICWNEWLARSGSRERRNASSTTGLDERKLSEICEHLDELSSCWSSLEVGQSMAVSWPDLAVRTGP
jgi:hypothetical protein